VLAERHYRSASPASFLRTGLLVLSVSCALQQIFNLAMLRLLKPVRLEYFEAVLCWWVACCIGSILLLQQNEFAQVFCSLLPGCSKLSSRVYMRLEGAWQYESQDNKRPATTIKSQTAAGTAIASTLNFFVTRLASYVAFLVNNFQTILKSPCLPTGGRGKPTLAETIQFVRAC
jgi:hypothetical protein